jgi:hypothetical protein
MINLQAVEEEERNVFFLNSFGLFMLDNDVD